MSVRNICNINIKRKPSERLKQEWQCKGFNLTFRSPGKEACEFQGQPELYTDFIIKINKI